MSDAPKLWTAHQHIAANEARNWHIPGADRNDTKQEALIALWEAARCYDKTLGTFPSFARLVIKRRLRDALRDATTVKHRMLTDAERELETPTSQDNILERREQLRSLVHGYKQLSLLEQAAVTAVISGHPYAHDKRLNNALQRARRKLLAA